MNIGIIGLGLIGGSMAIDLKNIGYHIVGIDHNPKHIEQALDYGFVDECCTLEEAIGKCEIFIIAIPVNKIESVLIDVLDKMNWKTVVMDAGSTKNLICQAVKDHPKRGRFVAAHPLAGTEFSGPKAAIKDLFLDKKTIVCEEGKSDEDALEVVVKLISSLGSQTLFMNPDEHDKHMAYVSHLSHVSSFTLGLTVLNIEKDEKHIFNLASTGFESTARLAKSNPETWSAIFERNSEHLSDALGGYIEHLQRFKEAIDQKDQEKLKTLMQESNDIKRVLSGIKLNALKLS